MEPRVITGRRSRSLRAGLVGLIVLFFVLLIGANWGASLLIDYSWWKELGQVETWLSLYAYSTLPIAGATLITWIALLIAHARGVKFAGRTRRRLSDLFPHSQRGAAGFFVLHRRRRHR